MSSGTDNRGVSVRVGGQHGGRGSSTVFNAAFLSAQFWDERAATFEEQAKGPLTNPGEMAMPNPRAVMDRVRQTDGYAGLFAKAFGGKNAVTIDNLTRAIAAYERTLITTNSPFDRWAKGDASALTAQAQHGFEKFTKTGCTSCHSGPGFSGPELTVGIGFY